MGAQQNNKLIITTMSVGHSQDLQQAQRVNGMQARQKVFGASHLKNLASLFMLRMLHSSNPYLSKDVSIFCINNRGERTSFGKVRLLRTAAPPHPSSAVLTLGSTWRGVWLHYFTGFYKHLTALVTAKPKPTQAKGPLLVGRMVFQSPSVQQGERRKWEKTV